MPVFQARVCALIVKLNTTNISILFSAVAVLRTTWLMEQHLLPTSLLATVSVLCLGIRTAKTSLPLYLYLSLGMNEWFLSYWMGLE